MDYEKQRTRMVESQLALRGIADARVLKSFMKVPRHRFVIAPFDADPYADHPLPIGYGQTISQPYIVALMTECLHLEGAERVLEVGTGSGYQAAILAELCKEVYTVERDQRLLDGAKKVLDEEGYKNIKFALGDGTKGWKDESPFDGIIVTAASPTVPESLKDQIADGGRLVIPVGSRYSQMLMVIEREGDRFLEKNICGCVFVPLVGKEGWQE